MSTLNLQPCDSFTSHHFHLFQLAAGVYAAINAEEGWAICNAGIIDLGDRTLVYDAFTTPQAASDLRDAAVFLTGHPVTLLVNSHYHNDHIWGNQAFGGQVEIISTVKTRELIISKGASEIRWYNEAAQQRLDALKLQFAQSDEEKLHRHLRPVIADYQAVIAALPILQLRLPNLTFTGEMVFHGPKRSARLIEYENAHTGSDAILHLPDDHIVFMADTLFVDIHPYLADGDPDVIQRILAEVKGLQPSIVVPGHGPLGSIKQLDILDEYINHIKMMVKDAIERNMTEAELVKIPIPKEYQEYYFPTFFIENLGFLHKKILHA